MSDYLSKPVKSPILEKMLVKWLFDSETRQSLSQYLNPPKDPEALLRAINSIHPVAFDDAEFVKSKAIANPGEASSKSSKASGSAKSPAASLENQKIGSSHSNGNREGNGFPFPDSAPMSRNDSGSTATKSNQAVEGKGPSSTSKSNTDQNTSVAPPLVSGDSTETIRSVKAMEMDLVSVSNSSSKSPASDQITPTGSSQSTSNFNSSATNNNIQNYLNKNSQTNLNSSSLQQQNSSLNFEVSDDVSMKSPTSSTDPTSPSASSSAWRRASDERSPVIRPSLNARSKSLTSTAEHDPSGSSSPASSQGQNLAPPGGMIRRSSREQGGLGHDFEVSTKAFR